MPSCIRPRVVPNGRRYKGHLILVGAGYFYCATLATIGNPDLHNGMAGCSS